MKAVIADGRGSVTSTEVAEPDPAANEAVVAVEAYSVNRGETFLLDAPRPDWRPGKDIAGRVVTAAADGSGPEVGTGVVAHLESAGWAERAAVATTALAVRPDSLPVETAAALPLAGLTALRLLRRAGSLVGRRLLITGASGGVGHYVVELAVAAGGEVTAVSATAQRGERLAAFGADVVHDVADAVGWFDVAMESVGGPTFTVARAKVRPSGTVLWFGQASLEPITVDFFDWVDGTLGAPIVPFIYTGTDAENAADLARLIRLVQTGRLHPELGTVRSWEHTATIVEDIRARRLRGNAVLTLT